MYSYKRLIMVLGTVLMVCGILLPPKTSFALGDYNFVHKRAVISFESEHHRGNIEVGFFPLYFHDRILEVPLKPTYVTAYSEAGKAEVIGYAVSVRKNNDYAVTVSGSVQVRIPLKNGKYEYEIVRIYETVY